MEVEEDEISPALPQPAQMAALQQAEPEEEQIPFSIEMEENEITPAPSHPPQHLAMTQGEEHKQIPVPMDSEENDIN